MIIVLSSCGMITAKGLLWRSQGVSGVIEILSDRGANAARLADPEYSNNSKDALREWLDIIQGRAAARRR